MATVTLLHSWSRYKQTDTTLHIATLSVCTDRHTTERVRLTYQQLPSLLDIFNNYNLLLPCLVCSVRSTRGLRLYLCYVYFSRYSLLY